MVGKMHETIETGRPAEEAQLDQAMTSMDPILQASLKREQQQRLRKTLIYGGVAMATVTTTLIALFFVFSNPNPVSHDEPDSQPAAGDAASSVAPAAMPDELSKEGWMLWRAGNSSAAEAKFRQAVTADPEDADLFNGLGWSQIGQQEFDAAIESFTDCVKLQRNHPAGLNGLGQAYLAKREYDLAEPWLRRASAKGASAARFGLVRVYLLQGEFGKAKAALKKLKRDAMDAQLLQQMAAAVKSKELSDDLRAQLEPQDLEPKTVPAVGEKSAVAYNTAGWRSFQSGDNETAEADFRNALKVTPDFLAAKNGLGFALLNQGKNAEALPIFEELVQANPKHGGFVNGLARCHAAEGDHEKAVEIWGTLEKGTGAPNALTWGMAQSLIALGRHADALPLLQRIKAAGGNHIAGVDEMLAACEAAISAQ